MPDTASVAPDSTTVSPGAISPRSTAITAPSTAAAQAAPYRRFVLAFFAAALLGCLIIAAFNFIVNPLGYYPPRVVPRPAALSQDRRAKLDLLPLHPAPEALILGSSRVMTLAPSTLQRLTGGLRSFNAGFSLALPEEYYGVLRYLADAKALPKEIVLGIDIIAFDPGPPSTFLRDTPELTRHLSGPVRWQGLEERARMLLSYAQVRKGIDLLSLERESSPITFDPDGLAHYVHDEALIKAGTFVPKVDPNLGGGPLVTFDAHRQDYFDRFLRLAAEHGVKVRAFLTPYHPSVLKLRSTDKVNWFADRRSRVMGYLKEMERRYPLFTAVDFTDIATFGGRADQFFDGVHFFKENGDRLLAALYGE